MEGVFGATSLSAVVRELTKVHEEVVRGPLDEVRQEFEGRERVSYNFV